MKSFVYYFSCVVAVVCFVPSVCVAQKQYTVLDLGTETTVRGFNNSGQVIGWIRNSDGSACGYRTAPSSPIRCATDDLGTFVGSSCTPIGINDSGQVVGQCLTDNSSTPMLFHAFRTGPNQPINVTTDDLGTLGGTQSVANGINALGQVVGSANMFGNATVHAFRTEPNRPINPATDDLGTLGGILGVGWSINRYGQVAGYSFTPGDIAYHAFRTAPNQPINPATNDLTPGEAFSRSYARGYGINDSAQVVGEFGTASGYLHAFRALPNRPIDPATDDLGTLGGRSSSACCVNSYGEVVGWSSDYYTEFQHAFVYRNGVMINLNNLAPRNDWEYIQATGINDSGQIAGIGIHDGKIHGFLLTPTPLYRASIRPPIADDGNSDFKRQRGIIPIKFSLTLQGQPTCNLPAAQISVTRTEGEPVGYVEQSTYSTPAETGSNFRIDPTNCQYSYNLGTASMRSGRYRVDILLDGNPIGTAMFTLR